MDDDDVDVPLDVDVVMPDDDEIRGGTSPELMPPEELELPELDPLALVLDAEVDVVDPPLDVLELLPVELDPVTPELLEPKPELDPVYPELEP